MKKLLTLTAIGGLLVANNLQAATYSIYVAGSTAFRAIAFRAIKNGFDGGNPTINPSNAGTGTGLLTFSGTMTNLFGVGNTVVVYCDYNGSVQGLGDLAGNTSLNFTNATSGGGNVSHAPTITFCDVDHTATLYPNVAVTETPVAVLPFVYCRNYYAPTTLTNVTSHELVELWTDGNLPLSFFTGNTNDASKNLYVTGRDLDSGTRVCASADSSYIDTSTTPYLWGFNTTAPTTWALLNQNIFGSTYGYGYSSGGNEAAALTNQNAKVSGVGVGCIGYLGLSDALTVAGSASTGSPVLNGGGNCSIIAYNGVLPFNSYTNNTVPAKPDFTPIIQGQYSFWSYENLEMLNSGAPTGTYNYYTNLVSAIDNDILQAENLNGNDATQGPVTAVRLSEMKVNRSSVGGTIAPN
jgi:hypothetical protein